MKKTTKQDKCRVVHHSKFLWWKWDWEDFAHRWVYKTADLRRCKICGMREMVVGTYEYEGDTCKAWGERDNLR